MFRRNAISRESPVHQRQVGGLEPTVAREHVCGPDVISTATVNGAREGAPRKARFSNATAEEQIQAPYTWTKPLAPNCGAPSVRSAAAFATGRKSARSRRHVSDMRQHSPLTTIP